MLGWDFSVFSCVSFVSVFVFIEPMALMFFDLFSEVWSVFVQCFARGIFEARTTKRHAETPLISQAVPSKLAIPLLLKLKFCCGFRRHRLNPWFANSAQELGMFNYQNIQQIQGMFISLMLSSPKDGFFSYKPASKDCFFRMEDLVDQTGLSSSFSLQFSNGENRKKKKKKNLPFWPHFSKKNGTRPHITYWKNIFSKLYQDPPTWNA